MTDINFWNRRSIMSREEQSDKKTTTEIFSEMFKIFGNAISEIFDEIN